MKTRNPKKLFPDTGVPEIAPKPNTQVTEVRRYKLITPLFGGGVKAQEADPITIIRGASVRGQLRFWWRATRGGQFDGNLNKMREKEIAIWGSAAKKDDKNSGPSKVSLTTRILNEGKPFVAKDSKGKPVTNIGDQKSVYSYVAFPLRDTQGAKVLQGVEFELTICYPNELEADVRAALWAWETFGGIGARTRRGFGALQLMEHSINGVKQIITQPSVNEIETVLHKQLVTHVGEGKWHNDVPHLTHTLRMEIFPKGSSSAQQALRELIGRFQRFRQQAARIDKKTGTQKDQGLSVWPEANALRSRLKKPLKWQENTNPKLIDKFPRAAFGLPILFHLPHDGNKTFTLQGGKLDPRNEKSYERLASRLILKPLAGANNQYVGLAAVLVGPEVPPSGLQIKEDLPVQKSVEWQLDKSEASSQPLNQILRGQPDVIEAFLAYLKQ